MEAKRQLIEDSHGVPNRWVLVSDRYFLLRFGVPMPSLLPPTPVNADC